MCKRGGGDMQDGSVTVERRKGGPDVWCFRWREAGPDGRRIHRRLVLGTADSARKMAVLDRFPSKMRGLRSASSRCWKCRDKSATTASPDAFLTSSVVVIMITT